MREPGWYCRPPATVAAYTRSGFCSNFPGISRGYGKYPKLLKAATGYWWVGSNGVNAHILTSSNSSSQPLDPQTVKLLNPQPACRPTAGSCARRPRAVWGWSARGPMSARCRSRRGSSATGTRARVAWRFSRRGTAWKGFTPRHTLHPTPCTLHPNLYTLTPTPYTRHPTPHSPHPHPKTFPRPPAAPPIPPNVLSPAHRCPITP